MKSFSLKLTRLCSSLEDGVLVLLLTAMIFMATLQIVLRNFFDTGLVWNENFLRILVLWLTLVGSMVATRTGEHIRIDFLHRYLPSASLPWLTRFINLSAALVCIVIARHSASFVWLEYTDPYPAFANVPTWVCVLIIPFGFAVMALRFFWQSLVPASPTDNP